MTGITSSSSQGPHRIALVTGAASGIGLAVARRLLSSGAHVYFADIRKIDPGAIVERDSTPRASSIRLDVTDESNWGAACEAIVDAHGRLDILVNCAGITGIDQPQTPDAVTLDTWRRVLAVNVESVVVGCRACLPLLRQSRDAVIVNISSLAGRMALPGAVAYAAGKAALSSYTRSLSLHCAGLSPPIRVNSIAPGAIETPMWDTYLGDGPQREQRYADVAAAAPLQRFGRADEVAACVAYLVSAAASYVTGVEIVIDGGQSLR